MFRSFQQWSNQSWLRQSLFAMLDMFQMYHIFRSWNHQGQCMLVELKYCVQENSVRFEGISYRRFTSQRAGTIIVWLCHTVYVTSINGGWQFYPFLTVYYVVRIAFLSGLRPISFRKARIKSDSDLVNQFELWYTLYIIQAKRIEQLPPRSLVQSYLKFFKNW